MGFSEIVRAIQLFFPYQQFSASFQESITPWSVGIIIAYFFFSILFFVFRRVLPLTKRLQSHTANFSEDTLRNDPVLKSFWDQYEQSIMMAEDTRKTATNAEEVFSEVELLSRVMSLRYWTAVPSILLALGIFGTFLGLTVGISNFDTSTTEKIQSSIALLLQGMATAFLTSLWGMFFSILFNVFEKMMFRYVGSALRSFCQILNYHYKLSAEELLAIQELTIEKRFEKYFSTWQEEKNFSIAVMLRDIRFNSEEQTKALKSFSTDMADGIKISTETISALGDKLSDSFSRGIEQALIPSVNTLNDSVKTLQNAKEESSGAFLQETVIRLQEAIEQMLTEIRTNVFSSSKAEMESLSKMVSEAGEAILQIPIFMDDAISGIDVAVNEIRTAMTDTTRELQETVTASSQNMQEEAEGAAATMAAQVEKMHNVLANLMEGRKEENQRSVELVRQLNTSISGLETAVSSVNSVVGGAASLMGEIRQIVHGLTAAETTLSGACGTLSKHSKHLQETSIEYIDIHKKVTSSLENVLKESNQSLELHSREFQVIKDGLKDIFGQIQTGLNEYKNHTKNSINDYLYALSQNVSKAIEALAGAIEELEESLSDLNDIAVKSRSTRANG